MSRVYFHSPSGQAELLGSERAWLDHVARGPARAAWDLDRHADVDKAAAILAMIPEVPDGQYGANYLHNYLREAQTEHTRSRAAYATDRSRGGAGFGHYDPVPLRRLIGSLQLRLDSGSSDTTLRVAGLELSAGNVGLNTALAVGSDPIRLAAKVHGWCEVHGWVDGPDRAWMADLIDDGLRVGVYRRQLRYSDTPDGPRDKVTSMGWEEVQTLLRSRSDEPVVMSYSVCDRFPNREIAGWEPAVDGQWMPGWATDHDGAEEWVALSEDARASYRRDSASGQWYDLPDKQQWDLAMAGLQQRQPWAQITPDNLASVTFGPAVTVYDLLAADRDERLQALMAVSA